jgi:hypothetical protein
MSAEANKALVRPFYAEVDKGSQAPGPIDAYVQSVETAQCNMGSAGTSTGANVVAAIRIAERLGQGRTVVTIACDSGLKYLSTDLYSSGP